jgi:signal transduction histidine kinase
VGDPDRIAQVVRNLLANAAKYSPPSAPIAIRVTPETGHATVEVADRGIGVGNGDVRRIFEKYERGSAGDGHVAGNGLGLYLSRQILRAHGSDLGVRPNPEGSGSVFSFTLGAAA